MWIGRHGWFEHLFPNISLPENQVKALRFGSIPLLLMIIGALLGFEALPVSQAPTLPTSSTPSRILAQFDADQVLISSGATWKFHDQGSDLGTAWIESGFDDSAWPEGASELGYGDGDEATTVSYGPDPDDKYITTYFRHTFEISSPEALPGLRLRLKPVSYTHLTLPTN